MNRPVYLDNSATTKPCRRAVERMTRSLTETWGNPSSLHALGVEAEREQGAARAAVAGRLFCRPDEIIFTGGGTEANNLALFGGAGAGKRRGRRIVTTAIEHPSVLETASALEKQGFEVIRLSPGPDGKIPEESFFGAVDETTVLVSVMLVNNETGAVQPVKSAAAAIKRAGAPALLHCDGVQAFGKLPFRPDELGVDLLSLSAHKIHGPKGAGALYKRKPVHLLPTVYGGGQEKGFRSGTEATPAIAGLLGALEELPDPRTLLPEITRLRDYAVGRLRDTGLVEFNSPADAFPYILNISVPGFRSEILLHFLESKEIYVSSGSACSGGKGSYVLRQMGLPLSRVDSALRISFSRENTPEDIDRLAGALSEGGRTLQKMKG